MGVDLNVGVYYGFLIWCEFDQEKLVNLLAQGGHYLHEWQDYHREEILDEKKVDTNWELVSDMDTEENYYMLVYRPLTQYDSMKTRGPGGFGTPVDPEKMVVPEEVKEEAKRLRLILMGSSSRGEEEEEESSQEINESEIEGPQFFAYAHFQ